MIHMKSLGAMLSWFTVNWSIFLAYLLALKYFSILLGDITFKQECGKLQCNFTMKWEINCIIFCCFNAFRSALLADRSFCYFFILFFLLTVLILTWIIWALLHPWNRWHRCAALVANLVYCPLSVAEQYMEGFYKFTQPERYLLRLPPLCLFRL